MKLNKKIQIAGLILLLFVTIIGSTILYVSNKLASDGWPDFRCNANLRNIFIWMHRDFANNFSVVEGVEGRVEFKDMLNLGDLNKKCFNCCICKEPYIYNPVAPCGDRMHSLGDKERDMGSFVMWCPKPCHSGKRVFLQTSGRTMLYSDNEISWFYQKGAKYLTREELDKENDYRKSHHMEILTNGVR